MPAAKRWGINICMLVGSKAAYIMAIQRSLDCHNIRSFATDKHANVDAPPFGGGHGMVMRPDVMGCAIEHVIAQQPPKRNLTRLYPSPRGKLLDQKMVRELSQQEGVMIVCGRYEGLDLALHSAHKQSSPLLAG